MKKLLLGIAAILAAGASVYAQGVVAFANTSTTPVTYGENQYGLTGPLPTGPSFSAQLLYAPGTDPLANPPTTLDVLGASTPFSAALVGRFNGGARTTPSTTAPGARAWFQVQVWEAAFGATYQAAATAPARDVAGVTRQAFIGTSLVFNVPTGSTAGAPLVTTGGLGAIQVVPVPEPTTWALGLLGLAGAFILRRRNS